MATSIIASMIDTRDQAYTAAVYTERLKDHGLDVRIGAILETDPLGNVTTPDTKRAFPFVMIPLSDLLARYPQHRAGGDTLLSDILDALSASSSPLTDDEPMALYEDLSKSERRVLNYLPSNLTGPEIAAELCLSASTVKTHVRHIYAKLGAHNRTAAVERARALGLLGTSVRRRHSG